MMNTNAGIISADYLTQARSQGKRDRDIADAMAANSPGFKTQIDRLRSVYGEDDKAVTAFLNTRFFGDSAYSPTEKPEEMGFVGRTLDRAWKGFQSAGMAAEKFYEGSNQNSGIDDFYKTGVGRFLSPENVANTAIQATSGVFSSLTSPVSQAAEDITSGALSGANALTGGYAGEALGQAAKDFTQSEIGSRAIDGVQSFLSNEQQANPAAFESAKALGQAGLDALNVYGAGQVASAGINATKNLASAGLRQSLRNPIASIRGSAAQATQQFDDVAKEAISKGVDERLVRFISPINTETKQLMKAMTAKAEEASRTLGGSTTAVKSIIGQQFINNADEIVKARKVYGNAISGVVASHGDDTINLTDDYARLMTDLRAKGAVFGENGKIVSVATLPDDEIPLLNKIVSFFSPDDQGRVIKTVKDGHQWRQKIFREIDAAKAKLSPTSNGQSVFSGSEGLANTARKMIGDKIGGISKAYKQYSQAYSRLVEEPADFFRALGFKGYMDDLSTQDIRAAEVAFRAMGNASAKPTEAIQKLLKVSREVAGYNSPVDEMALVTYGDELENIFDIVPTRSLAGQQARSIRATDGTTTRGILNAADKLVGEKVMKFYEKLRGLTPENRLRLLNELLDAPPNSLLKNVADNVLPASQVNSLVDNVDDVTVQQAIPAVEKSINDLSVAQTQSLAPAISPDNLDDVPLSQLSTQGVKDAQTTAAAQAAGASYDDAINAAKVGVQQTDAATKSALQEKLNKALSK